MEIVIIQTEQVKKPFVRNTGVRSGFTAKALTVNGGQILSEPGVFFLQFPRFIF
jgi:hypothetical protein